MLIKQDFIIEIGTEELPPRYLSKLINSFAISLQEQLDAKNISHGLVIKYATPRRLAVNIKNLAAFQLKQKIKIRGPALKNAYNIDGSPTKATRSFANSYGIKVTELSQIETNKGIWLYYITEKLGQSTTDLIVPIIKTALKNLPVKKSMRWGDGTLQFVRPVRWVLIMYGKNVISANIFGMCSNNVTYGHRIHAPKPIKIHSANQYAIQLEKEGKLIPNFLKRKEYIRNKITDIANNLNANLAIDENLLELVTGLVEHPIALLANFNKSFLRIPTECLISVIQDYQKCFPLFDQSNNLIPKFIFFSNLTSIDSKAVVKGNELVMHARIADAAFHYDTDISNSLESRVNNLKYIVYHKQLGSIYEKVQRISLIAKYIAPAIKCNIKIVQRASKLCKADLLTSMVYEFPELQGIMGYHYALHDKENEEVAIAIAEHYKPRFSNDTLPKTKTGIALAIADRIDSLTGLFGIGKIPNGEKDPFAIRRKALAIIRIFIEKNINLDLKDVFDFAATQYKYPIEYSSKELLTFFLDRLKAWYLNKNISYKIFSSVMVKNITNPLDFNKRVNAVLNFTKFPVAKKLAAVNKRVINILNKSNIMNSSSDKIIEELLQINEEKELYKILKDQTKRIEPLLYNADYTKILKMLSSLQIPIDHFFSNVMVNINKNKLRNNRINILKNIRNLFLQVADISLL